MGNQASHQIKVGIFVALGLAVLLSSVLIFGGDKAFFQSYYPLRAHFDSVQGLGPGSGVTLAGLPIGSISAITLNPVNNALEVTFEIEEQYKNRITEGSVADVRTQGALGDKYIYIEPGPLTAAPLSENALLETSAGSDVLDVIASNTDSLEKFFLTLDEIYKFTRALNEGDRIGKLLINLEQVSAHLKSTAKTSDELMRDLQKDIPSAELKESITQLSSILRKLDDGQGTLGALINDDSLHSRLKSLLGEPREKKALNSLMRSTLEHSNP